MSKAWWSDVEWSSYSYLTLTKVVVLDVRICTEQKLDEPQ